MPSHWLRWGLANFLPRLASNCDPLDLHFLSAGITGLSHCAWPLPTIFYPLTALFFLNVIYYNLTLYHILNC
jgi:hypothetical protein